MKKQTAVAWMRGKLARHRRAAQVTAFSQPTAPPVSHARHPQSALSQQTQPPTIIQPTQNMTESISITTSAKKISGLVSTGGAYITGLASRLIDSVSENAIDELSRVNGGITHILLGTRIVPFPGAFSAVRPMNRFLIISAQAGNQSHVERLTAAARIALSNRDVQAADKAIRALGAGDGFQTEVTGI